MRRVFSKSLSTAALFAGLLLLGTAQAASNPFAEARPGSRLPTIAENASDKCAGSGAAKEQAPAMPCGAAGKCSGNMLETNKVDAPPPAESSKCGGAAGSAKPASQCGGGK